MSIGAGKQLVRMAGLLIVSALLEVGGDAGMRKGLEGQKLGFVVGVFLLVFYGLCVNLSKLDFGKLMGIYIAIFFLVSQILAIAIFKEKLHPPTLLGGALIIAGGCVLTFWKTV